MEFEWDNRKARSNLKKHRVSFEDAITAFDDPFALIYADIGHSFQEPRSWLIGESDLGVVVVVYSEKETCRLISARMAGKKERLEYEKYKSISFSLGEKGHF